MNATVLHNVGNRRIIPSSLPAGRQRKNENSGKVFVSSVSPAKSKGKIAKEQEMVEQEQPQNHIPTWPGAI